MMAKARLWLIKAGFPITPKTIPELEARTWRIAKDVDVILDRLGGKPASDILEIRRGRIGLRKYFGKERGSVYILGDNGVFLDEQKGRSL